MRILIVCIYLLFLLGLNTCAQRLTKSSNIILISIDTLRADHLRSYGYDRDTSPLIEQLAHEGVLFREAIAQSPWTLPSHVSLLTGIYPKHHGVKDEKTAIPDRVNLLAEYFRSHGFATAGFVNSFYLSGRYGFDRGFEEFQYIRETLGADHVIREALKYLRNRAPKRFFLFLHFYDVHSDYDPGPNYEKMFNGARTGKVPGTTAALLKYRRGEIKITPEDIKYIEGLYDAEIRELSDKLTELFETLKKMKMLDNTLVIITSDHGEEFLDHNGVLHGRTLYDELVRVPLIFWGPGIPKGVIIQQQVQLVDIMPTLLEWCGIEPETRLDGHSLGSLIGGRGGGSEDRPAFSEADHNNKENDIKRMIRLNGYKFYFDRLTEHKEMYSLASDPKEKVNVYDSANPNAKAMEKRLFEWMERQEVSTQSIPLSNKDIDKLKSLGYVNE